MGFGGAFEPQWGNSSVLIERENDSLLLDCGYTVYPDLMEADLLSIPDAILLTHLHNDHCGSLANLLLHRVYVEKRSPIPIAVPDHDMLKEVREFLSLQMGSLSSYVEFMLVDELEGVKALETTGLHSKGYRTYAFVFQNDKGRIIYSGDLADSEFILKETRPSKEDLVFHDISFDRDQRTHAYYKDIQEKEWPCPVFGYHHNPEECPDDFELFLVANQDEFLI